jgi:hypothetical protein
VTGALLDPLDFGLLSAALFILVRRRRPAAVVVSGALIGVLQNHGVSGVRF